MPALEGCKPRWKVVSVLGVETHGGRRRESSMRGSAASAVRCASFLTWWRQKASPPRPRPCSSLENACLPYHSGRHFADLLWSLGSLVSPRRQPTSWKMARGCSLLSPLAHTWQHNLPGFEASGGRSRHLNGQNRATQRGVYRLCTTRGKKVLWTSTPMIRP
jgi:hypothetical protein